MDPQIRNNAIISYFFLGPLFLLAKSGTPLAHPIIQHHARRSSIIMLGGILIFLLLSFLEKPLSLTLMGVSLIDILRMGTLGILLMFLLMGAYSVFRSTENTTVSSPEIFDFSHTTQEVVTLSESEGVRTTMSFIPLVGIILAYQYRDNRPIQIGKNTGTLFFVFYFIVLLISGATSVPSLLTLLLYTIYCVYIGVTAILTQTFLIKKIHLIIPSTLSIGTHIRVIFLMAWEFILVTCGKRKTHTYREYLEILDTKRSEEHPYQNSYFLPRWIIGIPILNLITLRSLFIEEDREYRRLIAQGMLLTLICVMIGLVWDWNVALWITIIPMMELSIGAIYNQNTNAILLDFSGDIYSILSSGKKEIKQLSKQTEVIHFHYGVDNQIPSSPEK